MIYIIYFFTAFFFVLSAGMLFVFYRSRQIGAFIMGVAYGTAALVAIQLSHWWPLVAGFVLVWILKLMGLEPEAEQKAEGGESNTESESRKEEGKQGSGNS